MYCKQCGNKIEHNLGVCQRCKTILNENTIEKDETKIIEIQKREKKKERKNSVIYITIFVLSMICWNNFNGLRGLSFIIALTALIIGCIKCPHTIIIKILLVIFLLAALAFLLLGILVVGGAFMIKSQNLY